VVVEWARLKRIAGLVDNVMEMTCLNGGQEDAPTLPQTISLIHHSVATSNKAKTSHYELKFIYASTFTSARRATF
jgi:hypothetical protein